MKYYSDYQSDSVWALDKNGNGLRKQITFISTNPVIKFDTKIWEVKDIKKLYHEENQLIFPFHKIDKEQFDTFGIKWIYDPFPNVFLETGDPILNL